MTERIVQPGDCIESLAAEHGVTAEKIWDNGANAGLKRKRQDGHMLAEGDALHIPAVEPGMQDCGTSKRHRFLRKGVPAQLRLCFLDQGVARAGLKYTLQVGDKRFTGETDDKGQIVATLPPQARTASLTLGEDEDYILELGSLAPPDLESGARQRLNRLGLLESLQADTAAYQAALEAYQALTGGDVTGVLDTATKDRLRKLRWLERSKRLSRGSVRALKRSASAAATATAEAPRTLAVARSPYGAEEPCVNVIDQPAAQLAFLYENETGLADPSLPLVRCETLELDWFIRTWTILRDQFGGDALMAALPGALGGAQLPQVFGNLSADLRRALYKLHLRFMNCLLQPGDPAPVGLLEAMAGPGFIAREQIQAGRWYLVEYLGSQPLSPLRNPEHDGELIYASLGLTPAEDGAPTLHTLTRIMPLAELDPVLDAILQGLHFPQFDPDGKSGLAVVQGQPLPRPSEPAISCTGSEFAVWIDDEDIPIIPAASAKRKQSRGAPPPRKVRKTGSMAGVAAAAAGGAGGQPPGGGPPSGGPPGGGGGPPPPKLPLLTVLPPPPLPPAPPLNPMIFDAAGGYQPFVGVNHVGAGNNVALYDRNGRVIAFSDFGLPTAANVNTFADPDPCVCDDPIIFLSHWDYDHYAMVRQVPDALRRRWIAPQQAFGSVAGRELYIRLLNETGNGGALELWPTPLGGAAATHLMTDFGFLERAIGPAGNDDGLALYVRVADDPVAIPASTLPAGFGPRAVPAALGGGIVPGMLLSTRVICTGVINGLVLLDGEWADWAVAAPFNGNMIVVAATVAGLFAAPVVVPPAGTAVALGGGAQPVVNARWIPAAGVPLRAHVGGNYVPSVAGAGGGAWAGGWAIRPADFVAQGGMICDFSPPDAVAQFRDMMCVSPTPGSGWDPAGAAAAPAIAGIQLVAPAGMPSGAGGHTLWRPIWGGGGAGYWAVPMPPAAAMALAPVPAGPGALGLVAAAPPVTPAERYVVQPGDAGYHHLPAMAAWQGALAGGGGGAVVPHVVGLLATHHGSDSWIPAVAAAAALQHIPAAPGAAVANSPLAGAAAIDKIAYSYGVRPNGAHCYVNGGNGHPRPNALAAYLGNGWGNPVAPIAPLPADFHRMNTAPTDFASNQPYNPLGIPGGTAPGAPAHALGHLNGNVALGWDVAAGAAIAADQVPAGIALAAAPGVGVRPPLRRVCATCGLAREYFY